MAAITDGMPSALCPGTLADALRDVHAAEADLGADLLRLGDRHKSDRDLFHVTRTFTLWSDRRVHRVAGHAGRLGVALDAGTAATRPDALRAEDLQALYRAAARASLAWTALAAHAEAAGDADVLTTTAACHPEIERTMTWAVQRLDDATPQALAS